MLDVARVADADAPEEGSLQLGGPVEGQGFTQTSLLAITLNMLFRLNDLDRR